MTPQAATFQSYRKRMKTKTDMPLLGELVWYTVAESVSIDYDEFLAECTTQGLEAHAPKKPKDVDVFRRVCTSSQRKRVPITGSDLFENYLIRDVRSAAGHFWKQLVVETVDANNRKLAFVPVAELEFDPDHPDMIGCTWLADHTSTADAIVDQVTTSYTAWRGKVYGYSVREFIRAVILSTDATVVRPSGGVYFVMTNKLDVIDRLDVLVQGFQAQAEMTLHTVPLINDERQTEMVRAAYEAETISEINEFIAEVKDTLANGTPNDKKFYQLSQRMRSIKERTGSYTQLLDDNLHGTQLRVKSLEAALKKYYKAI